MIGRTLNGIYRISEVVGGGGFADVYLGRDLRTNTVVAIKVLHAHYARDPQIVQRFLQEARTAQALVEPHIVRVLDAGQDSGSYYIVMEYVQGHTIAYLLQTRGSLPIQEAVEYTRQILQALEAAHRAGIVHRDIKPQNVMVTPDGTVKVMDFGIAKHAAAGKMTQTGMYLGTPQYMSPEQARGERVDRRSDLYSVAIVLYEMLGGRPPFDAESPWQVLRMQTDVEAPLVSQLRADVPPSLVQAIARGLEKGVERRYQSAGEMLEALGGHTPVPHHAEPPRRAVSPQRRLTAPDVVRARTTPEAPARPKRALPMPLLAAGLAVVTILGVLLFSRTCTPVITPDLTPSATTTGQSGAVAGAGTAAPPQSPAPVVAAAATTATSTPTTSPSPTSTIAPIDTATPVPTMTATRAPTDTATSRPTNTAVPTSSPTPRPTISTAEMASRDSNQRAWSPDGQRVAYTRLNYVGNRATGWYVFVLDRYGVETAPTSPCQSVWPTWTLDGASIIVGDCEGGIRLVDLRTGARTLINRELDLFQKSRVYLSLDGSRLAVFTSNKWTGQQYESGWFVLDLSSRQVTRLAGPVDVFDQSAYPWRSLVISPDTQL